MLCDRLGTALAWLFFHSNAIKKVYTTTVSSPSSTVRLLGFTIIALIFVGRVSRSFWVLSWATVALGGAATACFAALGYWAALVLPAAGIAWVAWRVARQPGDGLGHRAGWKGYQGTQCENTIEGMQDLVRKDKQEELSSRDFPYLEFDIQETQDGQLVVFHDGSLVRAFPRGGVNEVPVQQLSQAGIDFELASIQDLTASQLQTLHIAGRQGLRVPLLRDFLRACKDAGIGRSLAIEVKLLISDTGRQQLIDDIRWYLEACSAELDASKIAHRKYAPLGWAGVIAFPHFFAKSFGEFGSPQWRRWAQEFHLNGIKARACHFHDLSLIYMP